MILEVPESVPNVPKMKKKVPKCDIPFLKQVPSAIGKISNNFGVYLEAPKNFPNVL